MSNEDAVYFRSIIFELPGIVQEMLIWPDMGRVGALHQCIFGKMLDIFLNS